MKFKHAIEIILKISMIVLIFFIGIHLVYPSYDKGTQSMSYATFLKEVSKKNIKNINYNQSFNTFTAVFKNKKTYEVSNPKTESFREFILKNDIDIIDIEKDNPIVFFIKGIVIIFSLIGLISLLFLKDKLNELNLKSTTYGNSERNYEMNVIQNVPNIKLSDIAGNNFVKKEVGYIIDFLKNPNKFNKFGARMPKGIIFYGPPGTGKTLTAKALAGEANIPFFSCCGSDFSELYVGVGAKRIRNLFAEARRKAPCIIFIDELDSVGSKRGETNNSDRDQTINALLSEMDGFNGSKGIIVIGATNRIDTLDEALIRPGRFDKHIAIPLPDYKDRKEILKLHLKNKKCSDDIDVESLSKTTIGFSGAGIESFLNESAINAVVNKRKLITKEDIDYAFFKIMMKGDKKDVSEVNSDELKLIAWHEAGHALIAKMLTKKSVPKVTITPSTNGAGGVTFIIPEKMGLFSKMDIINDIKTLYAGRIGEYLLLEDENKITTGASNDIKEASNLIFNYIEEFGMNEDIGLLYVKNKNDAKILEESKKLSKKIYEETLSLLKNNKTILESIANKLIQKETIEENELDNIINKHKFKID